MQAVSDPEVVALESTADAARRGAGTNRQALHFMLGAQRLMLEEMAFAVEATFERMQTEAHLFGEFATKLAASHSVQDWKTMGRECTQHQLEFVRRDYDRLFRHGERLMEATSNLLDNRG